MTGSAAPEPSGSASSAFTGLASSGPGWLVGTSENERAAAYLDPTTGLLATRSAEPLATADDLRRFEDDRVEYRLIGVLIDPPPGRFDLDHLRDLHRALFLDVYDWAGELRTIGMSKGLSAVTGEPERFASVGAIADTVAAAHEFLAGASYLRGLDPWDFADALAWPFNLVNLAHPFREGNGRTQRALWDRLAAEAGHELDWGVHTGTEHGLIAQRARATGDLAPLRTMLRAITS